MQALGVKNASTMDLENLEHALHIVKRELIGDSENPILEARRAELEASIFRSYLFLECLLSSSLDLKSHLDVCCRLRSTAPLSQLSLKKQRKV